MLSLVVPATIPDAAVSLADIATMAGGGAQALDAAATPTFAGLTVGTTTAIHAETAAVGGEIVLAEATANGVQTVTIEAPAALTGNRTITLPDADVALADIATMAGAGAQALDAAATPTFDGVTFGVTSKVAAETAGAGALLWLAEATANGVNKVILASPAALGGDRTITVPDADVTLADIATMAGAGAQALDAAATPTFDGLTFGATSQLVAEVAGTGAQLVLAEPTAGGVNTVTMEAPALAASRTITLPDADVDLTDIGTQAAEIAALGAENTDGQMQIPILGGVGDAGTWTAAVSSGGLVTVTRTADAGAGSYWLEIPAPNRSTASKGIKPTGLSVNYSVNTALLDDVRFELWKVTQGADGSARTAAEIVGADNADYDAAHNTAIERGDNFGAPELHLAVVTDAAPAYLGTGESLLLRVYVDGDAGAAGVFVLTSAILLYSETLVDLA